MRGRPLRRKKGLDRGGSLPRRNEERLARRRAEEFGDQAEECRRLPCAACGAPPPSDPHHFPTRAAGGKDDACIPLCRGCHDGQDNEGQWTFQRLRRVSFTDVRRVMRLPVDRLAERLEALEEDLGRHTCGINKRDPEAVCGGGCEEIAETDAKTIEVVRARIELAREDGRL